MDKNFQNFSVQEAINLSKTDAGKQLLAFLQQQNGPQVRQAMDLANSGNYAQAGQVINSILQNEQAQQLLQQLKEGKR